MLLGRRAEWSRGQGQSMSKPFTLGVDRKGETRVTGTGFDDSL